MSNRPPDVTAGLCDCPPQSQGIFRREEQRKYTLTPGPAASGRHKEVNKRFFATRLANGKRLEVVEGTPLSVDVSGTDAEMVQSLLNSGHLAEASEEEKTAPVRTRKAAASEST